MFVEIKRAIDDNRLIPLESVGLTGRSTLADAMTDGRSYFDEENQGRFLAVLDILTGREQAVAPLA